METDFTAAFTIETRGSGLIGLASCVECGAAVVVGETDFSAIEKHQAWHKQLDMQAARTVEGGA